MAYGLNTEAGVASYVNTIWEQAMLVARDNNVMTGLVNTYNDRTGLATRTNSQYAGATINTIAETDDLASQTFTPSSLASLTPYEVGAQYFITDSRWESDPFPVVQDASTDLGMAVATKIETDMVGAFSSLTGGTVGASGTTLTWGHIYSAMAILRNQKAPGPYSLVLHPYQWHPLGKAVAPAANTIAVATVTGSEITQPYFVYTIPNCNIYVSANITAGTASVGAMFARQAIAFDVRRAPRLEAERDASRRGYELNMSAVYGAGAWRPLMGVQVIATAASAPNS